MKQRSIDCVLAIWAVVLATVLSVSLQAQTQLDAANVCDVPTMAHQTIQAAVADADCDTVNLTGSLYAENVNIDRSVTIQGQGPANTTVDGWGFDSVFSIQPGLAVTLTGMTVKNGQSENGAGINSQASELTIHNSHIVSNSANTDGGGIYSPITGTLTLVDSVLNGNTSRQAGYGGGIYAKHSTIDLKGSTLSENGGFVSRGGGIYAELCTVQVSASTLRDNSAYNGAGIYGESSTLSITDTRLEGNDADEYGGGIYTRQSAVTLVDSTVDGHAACGGAGIWATWESMWTINNSTLSNNACSCATYGGGIHSEWSVVTIDESTFYNNSGTSGGAINVIYGSTLTVRDSTLAGNSSRSGGGIWVGDSTAHISGTTLSHNSAHLFGGGMFSGWNATTIIANSTLSGNSAGSGISGSGGGLYLAQGSAELVNSTLNGNRAREYGGGIGGYDGTVTVTNSIIADSGPRGNCGWESGIVSGGHNLTDDASCPFAATGDIVRSHLCLGALQDHGGPTQTHMPCSVSPAVDAGSDTHCPAVDQRGVVRPLDGDQWGGARCDIGAVEYDGPPPQRTYLAIILRY